MKQEPMKTEKQGHTPGPWEVRLSSNPKNGTAWRDIVSLGSEFSPSYVGEAQERDAKLIAAAPDMLEALQFALSKLSGHVKPSIAVLNDLQFHVRNAISKATE